jgi:hypothetical protein
MLCGWYRIEEVHLMTYLIYDEATKKVISTSDTRPTNLIEGLNFALAEGDEFYTGMEIEKMVIVRDVTVHDEDRWLNGCALMTQSPPVQDLLKKLSDLKTENANFRQTIDDLTVQLGDALLGGAL